MQREKFPVKYLDQVYDLKGFLRNHPGGVNYVQGLQNKDVRKRMYETDHSKSAFYLLREYKIGGRDEDVNEDCEDLEKLVDWTKPMLSQVAGLGTKYSQWVTSPVDKKLRLFGNSFLENLTITPWYMVPLIWVPMIIYYAFCGTQNYVHLTNDHSIFVPGVCGFTGVVLWSFLEYSLHRWVFHIEPSGASKVLIVVHFTIHGLHHKAPFDTRRLVFPPFPAAIVVFTSYYFLSFIILQSVLQLIMSGAILGYVMYDMIHYYLHSGSPLEGSYFYNMKRYHNQHHFAHHNSGFGISSQCWDVVFGTVIHLRQLVRGIKW